MNCNIPEYIDELNISSEKKVELSNIHFDTFRELIESNNFVIRNNMLHEHSDTQIIEKGKNLINDINNRYPTPIVFVDNTRPGDSILAVDVTNLLYVSSMQIRQQILQEIWDKFIKNRYSFVPQTLSKIVIENSKKVKTRKQAYSTARELIKRISEEYNGLVGATISEPNDYEPIVIELVIAKKLIDQRSRPNQQQIESLNLERPSDTENLLNNLSKRFNIPWTVDNTQSAVGRFENGTVYVNTNKVSPDTPIHEFAHPFVSLLEKQNYNLFKGLINSISDLKYKGQSIEAFVRAKYKNTNYTEADIQKEVLVTAIGLAATDPSNFSDPTDSKNLWETFLIWLENFLSLKTGTLANLNENSTVNDIAQLFLTPEASIDLSQQEFSTEPVFQKEGFTKSGDATKILEDLNKDVTLNETDPKNTFYIKGDTKLARLTEWVTSNFSSTEKQEKLSKKTPAEWSATKYYRKYNKNHSETIKWEQSGQEVTFDQLVSIYEDIYQKIRKKGSLIHAIIQDHLDKTTSTKERVTQLYAESETPAWQMKWLDDVYITNLLRNTLNLNYGASTKGTGLEDVIKSEFTIASEELGIGTTIDMLVEHSNNSFSLFDFKTGSRFLDDSGTVDEMQYSQLVGEIIKDSKLDKGKMELMLRAFIIKTQIPEARFRDLSIVHMGNRQNPTVYAVSMHNYLAVLEQYFKAEKPELYTKYSKQGLFKYESYSSASKEQVELEHDPELSKMDTQQTIEYLLNKIEQLKNKAEALNKGEIPFAVRDKIAKYTKLVLNLQRESGLDYKKETRDIGVIERWIGVDFEISHPVVAKFIRIFRSRASKANEDYVKLKYEQQKKVSVLLKEYYAKHPDKKITNKLAGNSITYHNLEGTGFWDFMWEYKTVGETAGYYARIIKPEQVSSGEYTQAQYDYNVWYRGKLEDIWKDTLQKAAYDKQLKEDFLTTKYDKAFMPRIPKSHEETLEQIGFFSKANLKRSFTSVTDMFIKDEKKAWKNNQEIGVPVKYLGSASIISNEAFSFNAEEAMLAFAKNMYYKQHVDQMYALGKGVMQVISEDVTPEGRKSFQRTIDWTNDFLELQVADRKDEIQLSKKPTKILGRQVSTRRIAHAVNNYTSASSMWLNVGAGTFNSVLETMFNLMTATRNSISKRLGMDVDFTLSDWLWASKEYINRFVTGKIKNLASEDRNYEQNDLAHRFIDLLNYDTSTFKDIIDKKDILSSKNKLLTQRKLYFFHTVGEEFSLFGTMMASLRSYKIKDGQGNWTKINPDGSFTKVSSKKEASGMWDAYKIIDGEMVYIGPSRGFTSTGEEIKGLTGDEISKLKRISQRIHGSYREDEKIPVERFILGVFLMKFKKYLPNLLSYNFSGRYNDWSLGGYQQVFNEDGSPKLEKGQHVYEWMGKVNEGRIRLLLKFVMYGLIASNFKSNPYYKEYRWQNMTEEQKKIMIDAGVVTATFLMSIAASGWFFDDDDEDTMVYKRFAMLQENLVHIHPMDILRMANEPFVQVKTIYKTSEALNKFVFDGLIIGERIEHGPNKGRIPGETYLKKKTPIWNIIEMANFNKDDDDGFIEGMINRR